MLQINKYESYPDFLKLEKDWNDFFNQLKENHPFLSYEWIKLCVDYYGDGKRLNIITVRDEKELVGILPLWQVKEIIRGVTVNKLEIINGPDTPFVDMIICDQKRKEVIKEVLDFLISELGKGWDLINLQSIPEGSPNLLILKEILRQNKIKYFKGYPSFVPFIAIDKSWEDFLKSRSNKFRKTRRNINNRFNRLDKVEIIHYSSDGEANLLEEIICVSKKSWKHNEGIAISSSEKTIEFFRLLTQLASQQNWLWVWILKVDGIPIAMEFDLEFRGKIFALRADFDEDFKEYSPGSYLEYHIIKNAFESNLYEYSTGPGVRDYKLHWTDQMRENANLYCCNKNLKGKYFWLLEFIIMPTMRKIKYLLGKKS